MQESSLPLWLKVWIRLLIEMSPAIIPSITDHIMAHLPMLLLINELEEQSPGRWLPAIHKSSIISTWINSKRSLAFRTTSLDGFCKVDLEFLWGDDFQRSWFRIFFFCNAVFPLRIAIASVNSRDWSAGHSHHLQNKAFHVSLVVILAVAPSLCLSPDSMLDAYAFKMQLLLCRSFHPSILYLFLTW